MPLLERIARRLLGKPSSPPPVVESLAGQLGDVGLSFADWHARRRSEARLYARPSDTTLSWLHRATPGEVASTIAAADEVVEHRFDLLGSGSFQPIDSDRPATRDGYQSIDWYLDPIKALRFPRGIPHKQWNLQTMRPGLADIKLPWELARCQHWLPLGQAYLLTGQGRYAREIVDQLDDFVLANPIGFGIHWTCTMDVALRALNWALALEMIADESSLEDCFWQQAYEALFDHGVFIFANLENHYEVTSNHFLSNLVGLYYLSAVFSDLPQGRVWNDFCRAGLESEMRVQVLDDGADYESSVPYHRLVTELFLGAARLAEHRGEPLSEDYRARLRKMVAFLEAVLRPDGRMPQVGDADDGRLHIFTEYGHWEPQDGRHLFAPAGRFFEEASWSGRAGDHGMWEAAWWGFEPLPPDKVVVQQPEAKLFADAGLAVVRGPDYYLLITNGIVGTRGFGNHKHNDQLSFEYHLDGIPLVVDPGSYVYTSDPDARNQFRGTAYHNTLSIDGVEQNEMRPEWLFRLFETAHAEHLDFRVMADAVEYRGRHVGYQRLADPVTHERHFRLVLDQRLLTITDRVLGQGHHTLTWHFHLAPGVNAVEREPGVIQLEAVDRRYRLTLPPDVEVSIVHAWYSPSYGVRLPCLAVDVRKDVEVIEQADFVFRITPEV